MLFLLFFVAFGLGFFNGSHLTPFAPTGISGILSGAALIFFAYTGFARVTIMAEEVQDPVKTIPRSIYLALAISTVLYVLVSVIALGLVGASGLSQSGSPLADAIGTTGSPGCSSSHFFRCDDCDSECTSDNHHGDITDHVCDGMNR